MATGFLGGIVGLLLGATIGGALFGPIGAVVGGIAGGGVGHIVVGGAVWAAKRQEKADRGQSSATRIAHEDR